MSARPKRAAKKTANKKDGVPVHQAMTILEDPALQEERKKDERERESVFLEDEPEWNGKPLLPFGSGRESIFYSQRAACGALDLDIVMEDVQAFFPDAIRILYLCSHEPQEWRHLRNRPLEWQEQMEAWADENISAQFKAKALIVAMQMLTNAYKNQHVPVSESGKGKPLEK